MMKHASTSLNLQNSDFARLVDFLINFGETKHKPKPKNYEVHQEVIPILSKCYKHVSEGVSDNVELLFEVLSSTEFSAKPIEHKFYNVQKLSDDSYKVRLDGLQIVDYNKDLKQSNKIVVNSDSNINYNNLVVRKKINNNVVDLFAFDHVPEGSNELEFFELAPSILKKNTGLKLEFPNLEVIFTRTSTAVNYNASLSYSISVIDQFDFMTLNVKIVHMLSILLWSNEKSNWRPCPTYYQHGYEFLNDVEPIGAQNMSSQEFKKYYSELFSKRALKLNKEVFNNIDAPNVKIFYTLLTEYATKLKASPLLTHEPPKLLQQDKKRRKVSYEQKLNYRYPLKIPSLGTTLFNFQVDTLLWALDKENVKYNFETGTVENRPFFDIKLFYKPKRSKKEFEEFDITKENKYVYNYNYVSKKIDKIQFGWTRFVKSEANMQDYDYQFELLDVEDFFEDIPPSIVIWVNKYTGTIVSTTALLKYLETNYSQILPNLLDNPGSENFDNSIYNNLPIFAQNMVNEEMGLGKTIELLSLMLLNKRKDFKQVQISQDKTASSVDDNNYAFDTLSQRYVLKTKTTLIVCPSAILHQWIQEIQNFAPHLKIFHYEGHSKFFKNLVKMDKTIEKEKRIMKPKFVVKLKVNLKKLAPTRSDLSKSIFFNFSSFPVVPKMSFLSILNNENANDLNLSEFDKTSNVTFETTQIGHDFIILPVIYGVDDPRIKNLQHFDHLSTESHLKSLRELILQSSTLKNIETGHKKVAFELSQYDIIVTSYDVITNELHSAQFNPNSRPTRAAAANANLIDPKVPVYDKVERNSITAGGFVLSSNRQDYSSPLALIQFWRIILDEVQMVSSEMSNAAKTCKILSRCHSWGVSGTPIKRDLNDLMSYFQFLRFDPFTAEGRNYYWSQLQKSVSDFTKMIINLCIRHDKVIVKDDIKLPKQNRILITSTFTPVEQDNYTSIFNDFLSQTGLNEKGEPIVDDWTPNILLMRKYLGILRKTCCYVNLANRKSLKVGAAMSMDAILNRLLDDVKSSKHEHEREVLQLIISLAEIEEAKKNPYGFKEILLNHVPDVLKRIKELEKDIAKEEKIKEITKAEEADSDIEFIDGDDEPDEYRKSLKTRLRTLYEILHKLYFFIGNAYFQISKKWEPETGHSLEELAAKVESIKGKFDAKDIYDRKSRGPLEKYLKNKVLETEMYKKADNLRNKMLKSYSNKVQEAIDNSEEEMITFQKIVPVSVGLEDSDSLRLLSNFDLKMFYNNLFTVVDELNGQADIMNEWLSELTQILYSSVLLANDSEGEEYDTTIVNQDKAFYLVSALEIGVRYRELLINGVDENFSGTSIDYGFGSLDQKFLDEEYLLKLQNADASVEQLELLKTQLKDQITELRPTLSKEFSRSLSLKHLLNNMIRPGTSGLLSSETKLAQKTNRELPKLMKSLTKEISTFSKRSLSAINSVYNARTAYFKQLQNLSDKVQSIDFNKFPKSVEDVYELEPEEFNKHLDFLSEKYFKARITSREHAIAKLNSRSLYLDSLRAKDDSKNEKICVICHCPIILGVLTECGHHFCKECLSLWFKTAASKRCPLCKASISDQTVYEFTYTKEDIKIGLIHEDHKDEKQESENLHRQIDSKFLFYKPLDNVEFGKISNMKLSSDTKYGAKITSILKLVLWIRNYQNTQIVLFSQYSDFLSILAKALEENQVKFAGARSDNKRVETRDIDNFKRDNSITCYLLNAHKQAAGLTLVNATHVILCEPLVNTALELQAINRIHRIGQQFETTIWMMGIANTVEESIINLSTKKRMHQLTDLKSDKSEISKHFQQAVADLNENLNDAKMESNQMVVDSVEMMGRTDNLIERGGEVVAVDELWESFFTK